MQVSSLSRRLTGLDGEDAWTAYQFDSAIVLFGSWVEGKLTERDAQGEVKWTLAELLDNTPEHEKRVRKAQKAMAFMALQCGPVENWDVT